MTPYEKAMLDKAIAKAEKIRLGLANSHNPWAPHMRELLSLMRKINDPEAS